LHVGTAYTAPAVNAETHRVKNKKVNDTKQSSEDPGIGIGRNNRFIALIAALVALLVVSAALSSGAWGESREHGSVAAQSPSPYPQSQPPAGFRSKVCGSK
jgi:hypothetical protein